MNIKGIIFDLDDTLILELDYIKSGFKAVSRKISDDYNLEEEEVHHQLIYLYNRDSDKVFDRFFINREIKHEDNYIEKLVDIYRNHSPKINLLEDAKSVLEYLNGSHYKTGLITDGYEETQTRKISVLNLEKYFDEIVVTDRLGADREFWKPSLKPFEVCMENLNIEYKKSVYIGDNINKDFIAPNNLGMHTIQIIRDAGIYSNGVKEFSMDLDYEPDHVIEDLREIFEILDINSG